MQVFIEKFFAYLQDHPSASKEEIAKHKVVLCREINMPKIPTDIELYMQAPQNLAAEFRKILQTKPNRSLSGVTPVAIMTSPHDCPHGKCKMCLESDKKSEEKNTKNPKKNKKGYHIYLPKNCSPNFSNNSMQPPTVFYERRKAVYDREMLDEITGGKTNGGE